jgi:MarR family transcriptional regulator, transcriptional regulator for hemolysin
VAKLTALSRGAVSKLISRLLEKGLVTRRESRSDRRYQDVELTKAAIALVPTWAKLADENDKEFFGAISTAERETLRAMLERIVTLHKLTTMAID